MESVQEKKKEKKKKEKVLLRTVSRDGKRGKEKNQPQTARKRLKTSISACVQTGKIDLQ